MEKRLKLVIWRGLFCVPTFFPSPSKTRRNLFGMFVKRDCHPRSESTFRQIAFDFQFFIEVLTLPHIQLYRKTREYRNELLSVWNWYKIQLYRKTREYRNYSGKEVDGK